MISWHKITKEVTRIMSDEEKRNLFRAHGPAIVIFTIGAITSGVTNYILLKEAIASNTHSISYQAQNIKVLDRHLAEYQTFRDMVLVMKSDLANAGVNQTKLNIVLVKMDDTLDKVNYTLTNMNASYIKDIESINRRLERAGI